VLVELNQRAWRGHIADREVAAQAEIHAGAEMGTMTVIKQLAPKHLIDPINKIRRLGRDEHRRMTVPGLFQHQYLLPTRMFETYMMTQEEIKEKFFEAVDAFDRVYPQLLDRAKIKLGTSFKDRDFPQIGSIKSYFDYKVQVGPVPEVNDWRLDGVSSKATDDIRNEVEDSVRQMYNEATRTMFDRTRAMLENFASQAKNYNPKSPAATLRDATIDQMKEFAEVVCDMNITGDPLLERVGKEMLRDFADLQAVELRRSEELRSDIATKAQKILSKLAPVKRIAA
jgi:hypothetical protein